MEPIRGHVWKYGDNLDTDEICPASILLSTSDLEELAKHAMEAIDPGFSNKIKQGDLLVAGRNTGCGSSREQAPQALRTAGVGAIIAESFSRLFFRNCITIGLPVLECEGISGWVKEGDFLEIELETGRITNLTTGESVTTAPLEDFALRIIEDGGLLSHYLKAGAREEKEMGTGTGQV